MRGTLRNLVIDLSFFNGWKHLRLHPTGCKCLTFVWFTAAAHMMGQELFVSLGAFGFAAQAVLHLRTNEEIEEMAQAGNAQRGVDQAVEDVSQETTPLKDCACHGTLLEPGSHHNEKHCGKDV